MNDVSIRFWLSPLILLPALFLGVSCGSSPAGRIADVAVDAPTATAPDGRREDVVPSLDTSQPGNIRVNPKVVVLPRETSEKSRFEDGRLIIPSSRIQKSKPDSLTDLSRLETGSIVVGAHHPDGVSAGILFRVKDLVKDEVAWRLTPDHSDIPTLEEIIEQGSVRGSTTMSFGAGGETTRTKSSFGLEPPEEPICTTSSRIDASVGVGVDFEPTFEFEFDIGFFTLDYVRASLEGEFRAYAEAFVKASGEASCRTTGGGEREIWRKSKNLTVWVGGVPVVIGMKAKLLLGYDVSVEGEVEFSAGATAEETVGIEIVYDDGWRSPNPTEEHHYELEFPRFVMELGADARVWLRAEVSAMVYDIAGPTLGIRPGLELSVDESHEDGEYYWGLSVFNSFYAGCTVDVLGYFDEYLARDLLPWEEQIASGCVTGACCSGVRVESADVVCDATYDNQVGCTSPSCGGTLRQRVSTRRCDGSSAACLGPIDLGEWVHIRACSGDEVCVADEQGCLFEPSCVQCSSCPNCSGNGTCLNDSCSCASGYAGSCCERCADGFAGYPDCVAAGDNECAPEGVRECTDRTHYQICEDSETADHLEWSAEHYCGSGTVCVQSGSCAPCGAEGAPCCDGNVCDGDLVCNGETCEVEYQGCRVVRVYPADSSSWTGDPCSLDSNSVYRAKSTDPVGNTATFTFEKCPDGGGPSVDATYWIVTGVDYPTADIETWCIRSPDQACETCCRTSGTWHASEDQLVVPGVRLWPDESYITPAREGEEKALYIQTGGSDDPEGYWWHQGRALKFRIVCN